jgi:2-polyprenyl-6-methoxyphenol hydroxylase-like FAD-dependent oxidoreductase
LSLGILKKLGVWDLVEQKEVSLLKEAKVFDGDSPSLLNFRSATSGIEALGYLVPNYQLRQALYHRVQQAENKSKYSKAILLWDFSCFIVVTIITLEKSFIIDAMPTLRRILEKRLSAAITNLATMRKRI